MSPTEGLKALVAVAPAAIPASIPAWGPTAVRLFGVDVPIASMVLSLFGLLMARAVSMAREGKGPGGWKLTGLLAIILVGVVLDRQPTAGFAVAWGVGIGSSGILIVDLIKDWVLDKVRRLRSSPDERRSSEASSLLRGLDSERQQEP